MTALTDALQNTWHFGYDDMGNVVSVESGDTTNYAYDSCNRLSQVSCNGKVFNYSFDAAGRLTGKLYPNGISTNYSYNNCNWLTIISHQRSGAPLSSFQYKYNKVGERTSKLIESGAGRLLWKYRYDKTGRLISERYQHALGKEIEGEDTEGNLDEESLDEPEESLAEEKAPVEEKNLAEEKASGNYTVRYSYDENGNRVKRTENGQATVYRYR